MVHPNFSPSSMSRLSGDAVSESVLRCFVQVTVWQKVCLLVSVKPHGGFVGLRNSFDYVWNLLCQVGDISLKTEKKKTHFVARAIVVTPKGSDEGREAIVFLRRVHRRGRLERVTICFECCWGFNYTCDAQRTGVYCKALDKWASSPQAPPAKPV